MNKNIFLSDSALSGGKSFGVLLMSLYSNASLEDEVKSSLDELTRLVETAYGEEDIKPSPECEEQAGSLRIFTMTQCRPSPDPACYFGTGKAKEAAEFCRNNGIDLVVADCELSPSQIKNLEDIINSEMKSDGKADDIRVIDRTMLILDIFAKHAVTGEGKLQVEIALLKYTAPRLTGRGIEMSRQAGTSGSIGARGPGETKLETDRRHIKRRISALEEELEKMEANREVKRKKRAGSGIPCVAIAGYTNAGKSTLLNALTDAGILAEDKLFATLDPTVRRMNLPSGREILLTDTVGFIDNLPHKLVEAFRSTLDEVRFADALLIIVDASDPEAQKKLAVTTEIINELDAGGKPTLYVFNKCDEVDILPYGGNAALLKEHNAVCISAKTGLGTDLLLQAIEDMISAMTKKLSLLIPFSAQAAVNAIYKSATVLSSEFTDDGTLLTILADEKIRGKYAEFILEDN